VDAFIDAAGAIPNDMVFDFTTYPHMKEVFDTLPREIQDALRPFVREILATKDAH
jgi:hypothetical protein